jgi:hypothetical protein
LKPAAGPAELIARLELADAGARRVAILDLISRGPADADGRSGLLAHLPREPDERAAGLIVGAMERWGAAAALPALMSLYRDPGTPVRTAIAAIRAHDAIERGAQGGREGAAAGRTGG